MTTPIPPKLPIPHPKATKEERSRVLTGTEIRRLVAGEWLAVFNEKKGRAFPVDLRFVFKVQLGLTTEKLHARWHTHQTQSMVIEMPDQPCYMPHVEVPAHHAATFDYWVAEDDCPLELKHTNERNNLYDAAQFYMPQLQWQLHVSGRDRLRFSIIRGNNEPEWGWIDRDDSYIAQLLTTAETFWQMLEADVPPEAEEPDTRIIEKGKTIPVNGLRKYDHATNNEWLVVEARYVAEKLAADRFKATDKEIRELIPADALEVEGKLTRFKRDTRGAYRCTILEGADA